MNVVTAPPAAAAATDGYACARDYQLFGPGPKRLLSLDGGGVRGAITVAFLERIETLLSQHYRQLVRLGDHFHLVGGTSTGSIIAGALALGFRSAQVREFYTRLAPLAFKRQRWSIPVLYAKFDVRGLRHEIENIVGDIELQSDRLVTGLCVVSKRIDTGSPWILSNNPAAPYWDDGAGWDGNKSYRLANLVRASTAAPHFFDPELLPINRRKAPLPHEAAAPMDAPLARRFTQALLERVGWRSRAVPDTTDYGLFIDGGVTPHNNPAFALLQLISLKPFNLDWALGPDHLTVVSIGTGTHRPRLNYQELGFTRFPQLAYHALMSMMKDTENLVLAQMQWLGECPMPWTINSEIGTLAGDGPPGGKLFRFLRYDVHLETDWIRDNLGLTVPERDVQRFRTMDDPSIVQSIYEIARIAADKQVKAEHIVGPAATSQVAATQSR
ncbi:MAG: patatin-like phospholipase family protein [Hyphomicrobiales bacterium]|nr:patatin-like phospholipase family protein [Hyphomicrobiales bacterium]